MLDEKILRKITAIAEHLCGYEDDPWQGLEEMPSELSRFVETFALGASKRVALFYDCDYVLKWDRVNEETGDYDFDEAGEEARLYSKAVKCGLGEIFPETFILMTNTNGVCFTIQKRIDFCYDDYKYTENKPTNNEKYKLLDCLLKKVFKEKVGKEELDNAFDIWNKYSDRSVCTDWVALVVYFFGMQFFFNLMNFCKENAINDLHYGNIGFLNNKPIILDFCGYHRD